MNNSINNPIISPEEGDIYEFRDDIFGTRFIFKILKEEKLFYRVLINNKNEDILHKNWELIEMFNTGLIEKIGRENVERTNRTSRTV